MKINFHNSIIFWFLIAGIGYFLYGQLERHSNSVRHLTAESTDQLLAEAYENHKSNLQLSGSGTVIRILPDDTTGSRHQRFILRLASGQTVLIAHNIDLAPRISTLRKGDTVSFYGEYEWNAKGGVVHWTHRDPNNRHEHGWLKHKNKLYQ